MADRMTRLAFPRDVNLSSAVLVPVPLSPRRQRERGYNQSFLLATAVAQHLGACVLDHVLIRTRETPTQTRLTPAQRLTNVADAFRVDPVQLARRGAAAVVLVDDVITTGATLNACAHALREAGVGQVCYLTFGRARDPRDARPLRGNTSHGTQDWH
jgi:ComF family protein